MNKYFETINFWIEHLLGDNDFAIDGNEKNKNIDLIIYIKPENMGKVIGKNGRIISSLRVLMSSIAKKDKKNIKISVKELEN